MNKQLISLNLTDILINGNNSTNINISITPVIDEIENVEERKTILLSTIQHDEDLTIFRQEIQTALDKLILAKGV